MCICVFRVSMECSRCLREILGMFDTFDVFDDCVRLLLLLC